MKRIAGLLTLMMMTAFTAVQAQDDSKYGETEEQQIRCKEALSVYKSFKKQKNYEDAYPAWQEACEVCPPKVSQNLYGHGSTFIKNELKNEKEDKERKKVLVDSLFANYDKWRELYPETKKKPLNGCEVLSRKAGDFYKLYKNKHQEAYAMFKEVLDCMGEQTPASAIDGYYRSLFEVSKMASEEQQDQYLSDILTDYLMLQDYIDASLKREENEKILEQYRKVKGNVDEIFVLVAQCDQMVPVLKAKIEAEPDNFELKKKVLRLMNKKDCTDNDIFLPIAKEVYAQEPSAPAAYAIGIGSVKGGDMREGLKYLEEAVEQCGDCSDKENYLLKAGQVASSLKQGSKARSYANKVLQINPNSGAAYLLHGDAIAGMASQCDDGAIGSRMVYSLAYDYYARAKSKDSSVADAANKKMAQMKKQFPSKEDIFTVGKKEGQSFTTCLGESTTIRIR
ncbi:tetratricopeptide repeat protein [Sanyastnella coralliicola]|uniref:tetratricopeptide repeat protein n=1 Tax=Sanyastnella coralliicola TaxID=3069118 RepID=UPI0027B888F8|nr:hypothetical protein [Longitalea sp. SCSIO 12813]